MLHYLVPTHAEIKLPAAYSGDTHTLPFLSPLSITRSPGAGIHVDSYKTNAQGPEKSSRCHRALWQSYNEVPWVIYQPFSTHCWGNSHWVLLLHHEQVCREGDLSPQRMAAVWVAKSLPLHARRDPQALLVQFLLNTRSVPIITFLPVSLPQSSLPQVLVIAEQDKAKSAKLNLRVQGLVIPLHCYIFLQELSYNLTHKSSSVHWLPPETVACGAAHLFRLAVWF